MQRPKLSLRRLLLCLLTSEERYQLYRVVSNKWIMIRLTDVGIESETMRELRKKGLVQFVNLPIGQIHFLGQRSPNDPIAKVEATAVGVQLSNALLDYGYA